MLVAVALAPLARRTIGHVHCGVEAYELLPTKTEEDLVAYFLATNANMSPLLLIGKHRNSSLFMIYLFNNIRTYLI